MSAEREECFDEVVLDAKAVDKPAKKIVKKALTICVKKELISKHQADEMLSVIT